MKNADSAINPCSSGLGICAPNKIGIRPQAKSKGLLQGRPSTRVVYPTRHLYLKTSCGRTFQMPSSQSGGRVLASHRALAKRFSCKRCTEMRLIKAQQFLQPVSAWRTTFQFQTCGVTQSFNCLSARLLHIHLPTASQSEYFLPPQDRGFFSHLIQSR